MSILLYDSDNPDAIPDGVWAAGYCDGYAANAWNARGWSRFPDAKRIAVFATTDEGDVCDVEKYDLTPDQVPDWVRRAHARGVAVPWVYVNRSNRTAVENALIAAPILSTQCALWVATLDGTQQVPAGPYPVAAVQYANSTLSGGHYDLSLVNDAFAPEGADMTPQQQAWLTDVHDAVARVEKVLGTVKRNPDGSYAILPDDQLPNYLGWSRDETARETAILAALADLKAHPAGSDPAVLAIVSRIEAALKAA